MMILAGLGNPGDDYRANRHNVGFMALDVIHAARKFPPWRARFQSLVAEGTLDGTKMLLMKPQTYMNESGRAVGEAMRFYKAGPNDVVVIYDEIDLAPGKLRARTGGGAAGHNGIRSLIAHIGPEFHRVRIGVGHPGAERVHGHVLSNFAKADEAWLVPLLDAIEEAAPHLVEWDEGRFMNKVAVRIQGAAEESE
jgi:peptidyl-tRNA hydrolase, PTH1 family